MSYLRCNKNSISKRMYYGGGTEPEPMPRPEMFPNPQMYQQALRDYFSRNPMMNNGPDVNGSSFDEPKMTLQDLQQMNSVNKMGYKNDNWNTNSPDGNRIDIGLLGRLHNSNWGQGDIRRLEKGKMVSAMGDMSRPNAQEVDMTIDRTTNVQSNKVQPQSLLKSKTKAQSFNKAFAEARQAGKKTFKWNGNVYGTQLKGEGKSKEQQSIDAMQYDDVLQPNYSNRQSPNGQNRQFAMGGQIPPQENRYDYDYKKEQRKLDSTNFMTGDYFSIKDLQRDALFSDNPYFNDIKYEHRRRNLPTESPSVEAPQKAWDEYIKTHEEELNKPKFVNEQKWIDDYLKSKDISTLSPEETLAIANRIRQTGDVKGFLHGADSYHSASYVYYKDVLSPADYKNVLQRAKNIVQSEILQKNSMGEDGWYKPNIQQAKYMSTPYQVNPNKKAYGGNNKPRYWTGRTEPPYRSGNMMNPNEDSFFPQSVNYLNVPDNNGMINKPLYDFQGQQNNFSNSVSGTDNFSSYVPGQRLINETPNENINTSLLTKPTMKEFPMDTRTGTLNTDTSFNGSDWVQGLSYLGQSAPAIYNAIMSNKPVEKEVYPLSNPYLVNNAEERRQINENADTANNVTIRNLKNENVGSYASNVGSALSGIQRNRGNQLGQSYQTQEQQNANIINQSRNTNNMIKMQEVIANAQNRALKQGFGAKLAEQIGMLAGQVGADMSKKNMDEYTVHMMETGNWKMGPDNIPVWKDGSEITDYSFDNGTTKIKTKHTKGHKLFGGRRSKFV